MANQDARTMAVNFRRLAIEDEIDDLRMLEYELGEIIEDHSNLDLSESSLAILTRKLQRIIYHYKMRVPGSVFLIFRALAILEGMGQTLHPELNTMAHVRPYGQKILMQQFDPKLLTDEAWHRISAYLSLATALPFDLRAILKKVRKGRLRFELDHFGYEPLLKKLERFSTKLSLSLIISALIIGTSIVTTAEHLPHIEFLGGIPYLGLLGLISAGVLLVLLFFAIIRGFRD